MILRSGVIENVKVEEYLNKNIDEKGKPVIQCLDHKTGLDGLAQLVVSKLANHLLQKYYQLVRTKITPEKNCEKYFFLTTSGSQYTQVYRKMPVVIYIVSRLKSSMRFRKYLHATLPVQYIY